MEVEEEEDVVGGQACGGPDFSGEEIGGPEHGRVPADELDPGGVAFAFGCRAQPLALQNIAYSLVGDPMTQMSQGANNAVITPNLGSRGRIGAPIVQLRQRRASDPVWVVSG